MKFSKEGDIPFKNNFGDGEVAYTNFPRVSIKKYTVIQQGFLSEHKAVHPTQKPISLFSKIIEDYSKEGDIVFDPFMGSGTTAIACINTKRNYLGTEISNEYYKIIEERLKNNNLKLNI